jgi:polygalacturonase
MSMSVLAPFGLFALCMLAVTVEGVICNVMDYGAKGDSVTLDTRNINKALGDHQCGSVIFPAGRTFLVGSLHLRSHIRLIIEKNATIKGCMNNISAYDLPEPNKFDEYQDFGHSHWQNSLIWGEGLTNVTIEGNGMIDGKIVKIRMLQPDH